MQESPVDSRDLRRMGTLARRFPDGKECPSYNGNGAIDVRDYRQAEFLSRMIHRGRRAALMLPTLTL